MVYLIFISLTKLYVISEKWTKNDSFQQIWKIQEKQNKTKQYGQLLPPRAYTLPPNGIGNVIKMFTLARNIYFIIKHLLTSEIINRFNQIMALIYKFVDLILILDEF